jgi:hypothetical protein
LNLSHIPLQLMIQTPNFHYYGNKIFSLYLGDGTSIGFYRIKVLII